MSTDPPAAPDPDAFVLSPARCDGVRGRQILSDESELSIAVRLRGKGAPLGEVFSFVSGLYFRGKLTYARRFHLPSAASPAILVIAPGFGLLDVDRLVTVDDLRRMAAVGVSEADPRFREPLERDGAVLAAGLGPAGVVVLLGSIATGKYVGPLERALGQRLRFPIEFVGRGDMSRGGLMLRRASEGVPLSYVPVAGAVRRGPRPPRLEPLR
jgi:hypothetical protein